MRADHHHSPFPNNTKCMTLIGCCNNICIVYCFFTGSQQAGKHTHITQDHLQGSQRLVFLTTWIVAKEKIILYILLDIIRGEISTADRNCITVCLLFQHSDLQLIFLLPVCWIKKEYLCWTSVKTSSLSSPHWLLINTRCDFKVHLQTREIQSCKLHSCHISSVLSNCKMLANHLSQKLLSTYYQLISFNWKWVIHRMKKGTRYLPQVLLISVLCPLLYVHLRHLC